MNSIMVLQPYKSAGTWVFDDDSVGLKREPFVMGIPEIIDSLVEDIKDADKGFRLLFSHEVFPGYQKDLIWLQGEFGGNWYVDRETGIQGWLCPALYKYFPVAPLTLFAKAEPIVKKGKKK